MLRGIALMRVPAWDFCLQDKANAASARVVTGRADRCAAQLPGVFVWLQIIFVPNEHLWLRLRESILRTIYAEGDMRYEQL